MSNWLTGVIVLLIIIILIDGYRRRNKNRIDVSPALKKSLRNSSVASEPDEEAPSYISELPNGGARVVGVRDPSDQPARDRKPSARELKEQRRREEIANRTPEQARLNLDESVPILMESVEQSEAHADEHGRIEPSFSARDDYEDHHSAHEEDHEDYVEEDDYEEDYDEEFDEGDEDDSEEDYAEDEEVSEQETKAAAPQAEPEEVLIINIMAPKGEMFNGGDLLDIVLKCGLRYGSMDIFHRYSDTKGEGALLFSMANMVRPGTFDLDAMDEFTTPGVSLFMTLPIDADSMQSFDLMVETAQAISQTLGGELKDEQRSAMTRQTLEHCRQRISDFERKKLFRRPR
ncbi:cell division protein ZipA [Cellvibrio sp.]|uniref:cell division protein ZipA n=1 Tax=Cellvibrio sp. TaxID=1965322 RepID=UPI003964794E